MATTLILVGGGKMGGAMLAGWLDRGMAPEGITVIEPGSETAAALKARHEVAVPRRRTGWTPASGPTSWCSPQAPEPGRGGVRLRAMIHRRRRHAQVNRGITVACANALVGDDQRRLCQDLLEAVGEAAWVEDESLLDAVTAVSGSGRARMAEAGVGAGATVGGRRIASPIRRPAGHPAPECHQPRRHDGGEVLMADRALMTRAIAAATKRSRELARLRSHRGQGRGRGSRGSFSWVMDSLSPHFPSIVDIQCGEKAILL